MKASAIERVISAALDRGIEFAFPGWARRRTQERIAMTALRPRLAARLSFEGADRGRRTAGWRTASTSANTEIWGNLKLLRDRCRDLVRNEAWAKSAVRGMVANTIGGGFRPHFDKGDPREQAWRDWSEFSSCDVEGRYTLSALQVKAERVRRESGEALIVRRRVTVDEMKSSRRNGRRVAPIRLQVLEPDFLDETRDEDLAGGGRIIQGVELSASGAIVAYWLFDRHPGDTFWGTSFGYRLSQRVPAADVIHYYREDRAGQMRGLPLLSSVILRLRDWTEFVDAQLLRQKIAAAFAGFLYDTSTEPATGAEQDGKIGDDLQEMQPGTILKLPSGRRFENSQPPQVQGFEEYSIATLLEIAAGIGEPYEMLTGDFSRVNFASSRMAWIKFFAEVEQERVEVVGPLFLDRIWGWFEEAAELASLPGFGQGIDAPDWIPPRRAMNDVMKETKAQILAIRAGLTTLDRELLEAGTNPSDHYDRLEEQAANLDARGLVLDIDCRKFGPPGSAAVDPSTFDTAGGAAAPADAPPRAKAKAK